MYVHCYLNIFIAGNSLAVQWLGLCASAAGGVHSQSLVGNEKKIYIYIPSSVAHSSLKLSIKSELEGLPWWRSG